VGEAVRVSLVKPPTSGVLGLELITTAEPLGLECVAGVLESEGHECRIVDLRMETPAGGLAKVRAFAPELVGVQCNFTTERFQAVEVVRRVAESLPDALVVIGGHDASRSPEWFRHPGIGAVAIGDGEAVMPALVRARGNLLSVPGLAVNTPDGQIRTAPGIPPQDLGEMPLPARHLISEYADRYYMQLRRPMALLETARGCPFRCNFCSVWKFHNGTYREKSVSRVLDELKGIDAPYVFITDDTFWINPGRSEELARAIKAAGIRRHFCVQSRSDIVSRHPEIVEMWRELGKLTVFLGVEKIDDEGLKAVNKRNTVANNERAVQILEELGAAYTLSFIVDPDWDIADFARLHDWIERAGSYSSGFTILTPLPGTDLWDQVEDKVTTRDWSLFDLEHAVLPTKLPLDRFYAEYAELWRHTFDLRCRAKGYVKTHLGMLAALASGKMSFSALRRGMMIGKHMGRPERYLAAH
jgi:radical SAM superfamily enzyme YgiQ (UPF0313 family)